MNKEKIPSEQTKKAIEEVENGDVATYKNLNEWEESLNKIAIERDEKNGGYIIHNEGYTWTCNNMNTPPSEYTLIKIIHSLQQRVEQLELANKGE